jgi:hypothetical protein
MIKNKKARIEFPVGYHKFHKNQLFNFQLNQWHSLGFARFEDMQEVAPKIRTFEDWKIQMRELAEKALRENRRLNAAFYYRAAEFYVLKGDPDKELLYDKLRELFYDYFKKNGIRQYKVPYERSFLPAIKIPAGKGSKRGTIVMHGGFDSFIEDFYFMMKYFQAHGYEVIAFEGPGQGAALKKYNLAFDPRWEKSAKAVLDFFKLKDVIWYGISMGGWLCFRAAAFEPRISMVMASGIVYDYLLFYGAFIKKMHE